MSAYTPLVSVIIPAYNADRFLGQTLTSVLAQTYQQLEILVVDDGSQDQTAAIAQTFAQRDRRVRLLRQANAGVAAARNLAIQQAQGEFIAPIDADDIWFEAKIARQVDCMLSADPVVGLVYAWSVDIDEEGSLTGGVHAHEYEGEVYPFLVCKNFLGHASAPLIRRSCLARVGDYNVRLLAQQAQGCEDLDLYLRLAEHYQFRVVREFLIGYRKLIGSMSGQSLVMARSYDLVQAEVRVTHPELPSRLYRLSRGNFYLYLAHQSAFGGHHATALLWLGRALQTDGLILGHPQFYILLLKAGLKALAEPVTGLIWPDQRTWDQFKRRFNLFRRPKTVEQVQRWMVILKPIYETSPWKIYEKLFLSRWLARPTQAATSGANRVSQLSVSSPNR